jgi:hypothetical protein
MEKGSILSRFGAIAKAEGLKSRRIRSNSLALPTSNPMKDLPIGEVLLFFLKN